MNAKFIESPALIWGSSHLTSIRLASRSRLAQSLSFCSRQAAKERPRLHKATDWRVLSSCKPIHSRSISATATNSGMDTTVCIGDLHGHSERLRSLWRNLELQLGPVFATSTVIFLGDYCDRGPDTAGVLDFLVSLPTRYPSQKHVFLCGNHDFGFSSFLGTVPAVPGFRFPDTWKAAKENAEDEEGWFSGPGHEDMHLQGRRWGGRIKTKFNAKKNMEYRGSIYDSEPTFNSYGVQHGDREGLIKAVPDTHKAFLQSLLWIYEQEGAEVVNDPSKSFSKLIAVHAGLEAKEPLDKQFEILKSRDVTIPRIEYFQGRRNVWETPEELAKDGVLVVSGHHGVLHMERYRLIVDESGGLDHMPIAAIILPSRVLIRDTDLIEDHRPKEKDLSAVA